MDAVVVVLRSLQTRIAMMLVTHGLYAVISMKKLAAVVAMRPEQN